MEITESPGAVTRLVDASQTRNTGLSPSIVLNRPMQSRNQQARSYLSGPVVLVTAVNPALSEDDG
jgi:hypothetical protein